MTAHDAVEPMPTFRGMRTLSEMAPIRLPFGLGIERDLHFEGRLPISVWAEVARAEGSISAAERVLYARAQGEGARVSEARGRGGRSCLRQPCIKGSRRLLRYGSGAVRSSEPGLFIELGGRRLRAPESAVDSSC